MCKVLITTGAIKAAHKNCSILQPVCSLRHILFALFWFLGLCCRGTPIIWYNFNLSWKGFKGSQPIFLLVHNTFSSPGVCLHYRRKKVRIESISSIWTVCVFTISHHWTKHSTSPGLWLQSAWRIFPLIWQHYCIGIESIDLTDVEPLQTSNSIEYFNFPMVSLVLLSQKTV